MFLTLVVVMRIYFGTGEGLNLQKPRFSDFRQNVVNSVRPLVVSAIIGPPMSTELNPMAVTMLWSGGHFGGESSGLLDRGLLVEEKFMLFRSGAVPHKYSAHFSQPGR